MLLAVTTLSQAHANLLVDGDFESSGPSANAISGLGVGSTSIPGWTVVNHDGTTVDNGNNLDWMGNGASGIYTPFGTDSLDLTGGTDKAPFDGVTQLVSTVIGQAYSLSFYLGVNGPGGLNGGTGGLFGGPISATASVGPTSNSPVTSMTFNDPGTTGTTSNYTIWTLETFSFTATSAMTAVTIVGTTGYEQIGLDNVDLETSSTMIPEPGALLILASGLGTVAAIRLRGRLPGQRC